MDFRRNAALIPWIWDPHGFPEKFRGYKFAQIIDGNLTDFANANPYGSLTAL